MSRCGWGPWCAEPGHRTYLGHCRDIANSTLMWSHLRPTPSTFSKHLRQSIKWCVVHNVQLLLSTLRRFFPFKQSSPTPKEKMVMRLERCVTIALSIVVVLLFVENVYKSDVSSGHLSSGIISARLRRILGGKHMASLVWGW